MTLAAMKYTGGANAILPVIAEARRNNIDSTLYIDSDGSITPSFYSYYTQCLSLGYLISFQSQPKDTIRKTTFKVLLLSTDCFHESETNEKLVCEAQKLGIRVIIVQDFWGNHSYLPKDFRPDIICVQDFFAKNLVKSSWTNYDSNKIVITGQPAFDYLGNINCSSARGELRDKFELVEDWPIIHFSGGDFAPEALAVTIEALNIISQPVYFFIRHHPVLISAKTNNYQKGIYEAYQVHLTKLQNGKVIDSGSVTTSETVNAAADITIGLSGTMLIQACYLDKTSIAVWTDEVKKNFFKATGLNEFPPCILGGCLRASNLTELIQCLDKSLARLRRPNLNPAKSRNNEYFKSDGQSAKRVFKVIKSFLC